MGHENEDCRKVYHLPVIMKILKVAISDHIPNIFLNFISQCDFNLIFNSTYKPYETVSDLWTENPSFIFVLPSKCEKRMAN